MEKMNTSDELKDAPMLRSMQRSDHPFVVPDGYFEQLPQQVQTRITARPVTAWWMPLWRPAVAMVALAVLLAVIVVRHDADELADQSRSTEELELLILHDDDLLDHLSPSDLLAALDPADQLGPQPGSGFTADELAAYLDHSDLPLDLLIELP